MYFLSLWWTWGEATQCCKEDGLQCLMWIEKPHGYRIGWAPPLGRIFSMYSSILLEFIHVYHLVMNLQMDARSLVTGCSGHLLKPITGRHVSIIERNGQLLSRSSITGDNMSLHIQSGTSMSSKFIGLTTASNNQVEDERLIAPMNSSSISSRYLVQLLTFILHLYFSGYGAWRGLKNVYQKDTCWKRLDCVLKIWLQF